MIVGKNAFNLSRMIWRRLYCNQSEIADLVVKRVVLVYYSSQLPLRLLIFPLGLYLVGLLREE